MNIAELQHITLDIIKQLYIQYEKDVQHSQLLTYMNAKVISNKVAYKSFKIGLWELSKPLRPEQVNEDFVGAQFPKSDVSSVRSILWRYVGLGILTPRAIKDEENQFFEISQYGEQVLVETKESPYDPFGFLNNLYTHSPKLEPESFNFIKEAIDCFLGRYLRASMVMLGLTSENEIYKIIELYGETLELHEKEPFNKEISACTNIKRKFDVLYEQLDSIRKELPVEIRELDTWLNGIFQTIRMSRNDAGHPIGITHTSEDVFSHLALFSRYAHNLSKLKDYLYGNIATSGNNQD